MKKIFVIICLVINYSSHAQSNELGSWDIINFFYKPNTKFFYYAEVQTRSQKLVTDFYYHEFKAGMGMNFNKTHSVFAGIGDYTTYTYPGNYEKPMAAKETRLWEQLVLNNNIGRVKIEHRYRIEQRWINGDYFNRFRYRINPIIPINHNKIIAKTFFATAFDEIFLTNEAPYFQRNRFFIGSGYQFTKFFALQLGWIRQYDYNATTGGVGKNYIQTTLLFVLDKSSKTNAVEKLPSTLD